MSKQTTTEPKYVLFDAKNKILGRFAVEVASVLSGKKEIDFQPNVGGKDWAIVINADKVRLSGEKAKKKIYYWHTGYPGGIKQATFQEMIEDDSRKIIVRAVKGMLPKNKLSVQALKRLRVFKDEKHTFKNEV
jgi:large subunit ribosomal protein L13